MTIDPAQSRYCYLRVAPWFAAPHVQLTIEYYDSDTGRVAVAL